MNFSLPCESLMCGLKQIPGQRLHPKNSVSILSPGLGAARMDPPEQAQPLPLCLTLPRALSPCQQSSQHQQWFHSRRSCPKAPAKPARANSPPCRLQSLLSANYQAGLGLKAAPEPLASSAAGSVTGWVCGEELLQAQGTAIPAPCAWVSISTGSVQHSEHPQENPQAAATLLPLLLGFSQHLNLQGSGKKTTAEESQTHRAAV